MPAIFSPCTQDHGVTTMSKTLKYRNGYAAGGAQSWLSKWMDRNNFTCGSAANALGINVQSFRKYLKKGERTPTVICYAAKCIDENIPAFTGNSLFECGIPPYEIAIFFNISVAAMYKLNGKGATLPLKWRLATAYMVENHYYKINLKIKNVRV